MGLSLPQITSSSLSRASVADNPLSIKRSKEVLNRGHPKYILISMGKKVGRRQSEPVGVWLEIVVALFIIIKSPLRCFAKVSPAYVTLTRLSLRRTFWEVGKLFVPGA